MSYLSASKEEAAEAIVQDYARLVNTRLHLRTPDEMTALLAPWYVLENQPLQQFTRTGDPLLYERAQRPDSAFMASSPRSRMHPVPAGATSGPNHTDQMDTQLIEIRL